MKQLAGSPVRNKEASLRHDIPKYDESFDNHAKRTQNVAPLAKRAYLDLRMSLRMDEFIRKTGLEWKLKYNVTSEPQRVNGKTVSLFS